MKIEGISYFSASEMKNILKVTDAELAHLRSSDKLQFETIGDIYWYQLPDSFSLLAHPLGVQLTNWFRGRHPVDIENSPQSSATLKSLEMLVAEVLLPIERKFGNLLITYGFTSALLSRYILKNARAGTASKIDQHASHDTNSKQNPICDRGGSACDIIVEGVKTSEVVRYITAELNYDRIYYYGAERPLHISVNEAPKRHLQLMSESETGRRYPGKKGYDQDAINLAKEL